MKMGVWKKCGTDGGLCVEDGAEAGAAWPPLLIWEWSLVHAALHAIQGTGRQSTGWHQPAPGQGARRRLNSMDDGPHLGPLICSS